MPTLYDPLHRRDQGLAPREEEVVIVALSCLVHQADIAVQTGKLPCGYSLSVRQGVGLGRGWGRVRDGECWA